MKCQIKHYSDLELDELYEILRMRNEVFVLEQNCIYQDCDRKDKKAYHLTYVENDKVVAYLRILNKGVSYDEVSIGRVLVAESHRRKGLAQRMMLEAIDFIETTLAEKEIRISAQHYLVAFYESVGFVTSSEVYQEDNMPHIEMFYKKQG